MSNHRSCGTSVIWHSGDDPRGWPTPALAEQNSVNGFGQDDRIRGAGPELPVHKPTCGHTRRLTGRVGASLPARPMVGDVRAHVATSGRFRCGRGFPRRRERRTCNPSPWSYDVRPPRVGQRQPRFKRVE